MVRNRFNRKPVPLAVKLERARAAAERLNARRCEECGAIRPLNNRGWGVGACTKCGSVGRIPNKEMRCE